ncbi:hypothetical protein L1987_82658 [Smallanthus sonchifolius]|uniref:Uncharacterized protein n=1 Tax=Smallanthus sonchifolius TaxID=185202 RepID=A0ACB8YAA8_9ASTR|nr:hypothetical protein L1987_82658 [Smallanthus sonchifolius]
MNSMSLSPSPSRHLSSNFIKNSSISITKTPNAAATNGVYTPSEETLYDLLGISQSGTPSEIKRAYKQMALKYHPDVSPPDEVHEYTTRFIRVQEAYETLSDPESRAMYDCDLGKKGSRPFEAPWKQSWEVQVEELKRRSTVEMEGEGHGGRMSWAARIRKQRAASNLD